MLELGTGLVLPPEGSPPTSLEGTAQPRLAVPLVVADGPVAAFGGRFGAVTPDTQLVSTTLAVPSAELQREGKTQAAHGPEGAQPVPAPSPEAWRQRRSANPHPPTIDRRKPSSLVWGCLREVKGGGGGSWAGNMTPGGVLRSLRFYKGWLHLFGSPPGLALPPFH